MDDTAPIDHDGDGRAAPPSIRSHTRSLAVVKPDIARFI